MTSRLSTEASTFDHVCLRRFPLQISQLLCILFALLLLLALLSLLLLLVLLSLLLKCEAFAVGNTKSAYSKPIPDKPISRNEKPLRECPRWAPSKFVLCVVMYYARYVLGHVRWCRAKGYPLDMHLHWSRFSLDRGEHLNTRCSARFGLSGGEHVPGSKVACLEG